MHVLELSNNDYDEVFFNGTNAINVEAAFRKVNKHWTAFLIWRIEDMSVTALPKEQYGIFSSEDSYVIYSASQHGQPSGVETVPREIRNENLEYHVHFWLGSETTPNKSGVAAFKTVELDNLLNGIVTQHRESQGFESSRFKSYFKHGIRVIKSNEPTKINSLPKLFIVKGRCCPILTEVGDINWSSFNSSYVLLLQTKTYIFLWIGRSSTSSEKIHSLKIAEEMKSLTTDSQIVFVDDGYEKTLSQDHKQKFNEVLPLDKRIVSPGVIETQQISCDRFIRLYKCSDNNGKYKVTEIKDGPLNQRNLRSEDIFIIDQGSLGIWIWVGRKSNQKEKTEALRNARGFVKKKKYPSVTKVTRVVDGYEPNEFKFLFSSWRDESKTNTKGSKPTILTSKFDAQAMEDRPSLAAETQLIDNGSGRLTVWRVENPKAIEIPKERHGYFFAGDCYIVLYTYTTKSEKHLLYSWLGSHATQADIDCTILKLSEIESELERIGFQGRIIQGYEPAHFLQIFSGKLIIFQGRGSAFDGTGRNMKYPSHFLAQVYGTSKYESKAIQVPLKSSSLDSNYCYVLVRSKQSFIWCGNYSNGDQREMAKGFVKKDLEIILEGKEKPEFFDLLGGKTTYNTDLMKPHNDIKIPRLFSCSSSKGCFIAEEIYQFSQKNLVPESIVLLDANSTLYIWIGNLSTKEEQRLCLKYAIDYLEIDPAGRDMNIPIIQVKQEEEPPTFTGFFPTWNKKYWKHYRTFARLRKELETKGMCNGEHKYNGENLLIKTESNEFDKYDKYPLDLLLVQNDNLPGQVDPLRKELYLTHDDFLAVFKMSYLEFQDLPKWKQQEMKKQVKLF